MHVSADLLSIITDEETTSRWNVEAPMGTSVVVTFSFPTSLPDYNPGVPGFQSFTESHKIWVRRALETWSEAGGISFVEVPADVGGQITFSMRDMTGLVNSVGNQLSGFAYYPGVISTYDPEGNILESLYSGIGGDVFLNAAYYAANSDTISPGIRGYSILLHEIGHTVGLKHPFEGEPVITPGRDSGLFTVLSYNRSQSTTTLGLLDNEAMQFIYGDTDLNGSWDARFKAVVHNGSEASEILVGLDINDIIFGNQGDDELRGKQGNDRLYDGAGNDVVYGGDGRDFVVAGNKGTDTYDGGAGRDHISYAGSKGGVWIDLETGLGAKGWAKGDTLTGFENATGSNKGGDSLTGSRKANTLKGLGGDDELFGAGGKDKLFGGKGADTLNGGRGNDLLKGEQGQDIFVFGTRSGDDVIVDFRNNVDTIMFDRPGVWTTKKIMATASQIGDDVVFQFNNGDSLLVQDTRLAALRNDIAIAEDIA